MTRVKICGITNLEDALVSAKFGADALGFNFYAKSPRYISPEKAREIIEQLPANILKVGVFVNETLEKITEIAETARLDALQLHGEETPEFARELKAKTGLEIIKAFRVSPEFRHEDVLLYDTDAILLDAYNPKEHGGTGETFDWQIAKQVQEIFPKMYLAGGLNIKNVSWAVNRLSPYYIDVCSGIEAEKGRKNRTHLINFLKVAKFDHKIKDKLEIYRFFWQLHPNHNGFRLFYVRLESLKAYFDGFVAGRNFGAGEYWDVTEDAFFGRFYKDRQHPVTGIIDESMPEKHLSFRWFVNERCQPVRGGDWFDLIINEAGGDGLDAVYLFYALLEEYRLNYEDL